MSFTESNLQLDLALELGETTAPATTDDEYVKRRALINRSIRIWNRRKRWNEYKVTDTTLYTTSNVAYVLLPQTFRKNSLTGRFTVADAGGNDIPYRVIDLENKGDFDISARLVWTSFDTTTGTWRLNFSPTPTGNFQIKCNYRIEPTPIQTTSDLIIPDYDWMVFNTAGLYLMSTQDQEQDGYGREKLQIAEQLLQTLMDDDNQSHPNITHDVYTSMDFVGAGNGII